MITVDGRLESRKYTDKDGNNRTAIEIIADHVFFGDSKGNEKRSENSESGEFVPEFDINDFEEIDSEDDLPF